MRKRRVPSWPGCYGVRDRSQFLSAGNRDGLNAQEEMPLAEAGTAVTESAEEFGDSSDSIADIAEEGQY